MARVRRASHVFFRCRDARLLDVESLLRSKISVERRPELVGISLLTGDEQALTRAELDVLLALSEDWVDEDELPPAARPLVPELVRRGLLISDDPATETAELRRRDERLAAEQWHPHAALYHFGTRASVPRAPPGEAGTGDPEELAAAAAQALVESFGPPPPAFSEPEGLDVVELPAARDATALADVLRERRTTRSFDSSAVLPLDRLATVLDAVFGCVGSAQLAESLVVLRKTSPSGGALHPIEVYPLVLGVESLQPGLYHYRPRTHSLALLDPLDLGAARAFATDATAGQAFFSSAHVLFLLTGRFYRSFWKYRSHERAYAVLLMDAAHLTQTLYLVCASLELGAFVTAAIDRVAIEERLRLDPFGEGALVVAGCGLPGPRLPSEPEFEPFVPRTESS